MNRRRFFELVEPTDDERRLGLQQLEQLGFVTRPPAIQVDRDGWVDEPIPGVSDEEL